MDFEEKMKVCVFGLWHLGTVTAACLASGGHHVVGLDFDEKVIAGLKDGQPPLFEPGLEDLVKKGIAKNKLEFSTDINQAVHGAQVIWVTYDTPVDGNDRADVDFVVGQITCIFQFLEAGQEILISSQMPVGSVKHIEELLAEARPDIGVFFACSPENLRLGKAISVFTQPDRVIVGVRNAASKKIYSELLAPFTNHIEWMSVESAEMTKHALNAFLATSVTFINEIAIICEQVGADAKEVERGLKSEARIGQKAYLGPGGAFAGGTLARDIAFLIHLSEKNNIPVQLIPAIRASNDAHKNWARRHLYQLLGDLKTKTIAVWGLTYKPGTDTLRRSSAIELCEWLLEKGAQVQAHDPVVRDLPKKYKQVNMCASPVDAAKKADALVVATEWPIYHSVNMSQVVFLMNTPIVLDANRFLDNALGAMPEIKYISVGKFIKCGFKLLVQQDY